MGLVLSRHKDEWIDIAGGVSAGGLSVCVVDIRGDKVRLLIEGPEQIPVHRREVQNAIEQESGAGSTTSELVGQSTDEQSTDLSTVAAGTIQLAEEE